MNINANSKELTSGGKENTLNNFSDLDKRKKQATCYFFRRYIAIINTITVIYLGFNTDYEGD